MNDTDMEADVVQQLSNVSLAGTRGLDLVFILDSVSERSVLTLS